MLLLVALLTARADGPAAEAVTPAPLVDDDAIVQHVKDVVSHELLALRGCYEAARVEDPTLQGRWTLDFTVGADVKVSAWTFRPLKAPLPVAKTVTFRPTPPEPQPGAAPPG